jgi:hypothetical protein
VYKPKPTRGEGGERSSSKFMEKWHHRDLFINRSLRVRENFGMGPLQDEDYSLYF